MKKFRIVPVITATSIEFIVQYKSFFKWKTCSRMSGSVAGVHYETIYFISVKEAALYIKENYGKKAHIINYRC